MPQSAEHLAILDLLDVRSGVIALTKADIVDRETIELAAIDIGFGESYDSGPHIEEVEDR